MRKLVFLTAGAVLVFCLTGTMSANAEEGAKKIKYVKVKGGLNSLIAYGKSQGDMVQELKKETEKYRKVKAAIERKELKKGESAERMTAEYGEPVIVLDEGDSSKWVYKPDTSTFFDGTKIYLTFDGKDELTGWEEVAVEEKE